MTRETFVQWVTVRPGAEETFLEFEALVLPLLERHGGRLERRLRGDDEEGRLTEVHVVSFANEAGFESYLADPERVGAIGLRDASVLESRLVRVADVEPAV